MRVYFLIIIFPLAFIQSLFCQKFNDEIEWNEERKLNWSDFNVDTLNRVKVNGANFEAEAISCVRLVFEYYYIGDSLNLFVRNLFIPHESYVYTEKPSNQLLSHEQGHFNLSELYARKIREKIRDFQVCGELDLEKCVAVYRCLKKELDVADKRYDEDTLYGTLKSEQERWNSKIKKELSDFVVFEKE